MSKWKDKIRDSHCERCPLHEGADHVCLMGSGKRSSRIMVVGEAPGANEDREGRPFIGKAGQLLDESLDAAGLNRADVYVTNVAKCRPPDNRQPKRGEIKACVAQFFGEELRKVEPEFILVMGNAALQGVIGRSGITKYRGKVVEDGNAQILPTFHPAAVLRNPRYGDEFRSDIQRLGRMVRGERAEIAPTKVRLVNTKQRLVRLRSRLMKADHISFDLETFTDVAPPHPKMKMGLQDWHGDDSKIVTISFTCDEGMSWVVPVHHESTPWKNPDAVIAALKPCLEREDCKYIAQNGKFDCRWLASKGVFVPLTFDTMLANHMIDENRPKSLDYISQVLLGADEYNDNLNKGRLYFEPLKRVAVYNGKDTDYTYRAYKLFRGELDDDPRVKRVFTKLMMPASNVLTKVERTGQWIDMKRWHKRHKKAEKVVEEKRQSMLEYVPRAKHGSINFNSPMQVAEWLFEDIGLDPIEETASGANSTKESVLLKLAKQHDGPAALLEYRKWAKYLSTYFIPWRNLADRHDRIHPTYKLFGTVTGRLSCVDPNLQQVPRDTFIRGILGAPSGWVYVEADYSQIELRIAAMLAGEKRMLRAYALGEDLHMKTAVETTGKLAEDISKEERKKAKAVNFGFLYGMGHNKFIDYALDNYDVVVSEAEAKRTRERFFESYPALRPWHERQRRLARRYKRVSSPLGRVRHLPDIASADEMVKGDAERQAINSPVQCCASDLMLTAMIELDRRLPQGEAYIVGSVHDALNFQVRERSVDKVLPIIKETMEDMDVVRKRFGADITVPIQVDIEVGQHWSEGEPWQ